MADNENLNFLFQLFDSIHEYVANGWRIKIVLWLVENHIIVAIGGLTCVKISDTKVREFTPPSAARAALVPCA